MTFSRSFCFSALCRCAIVSLLAFLAISGGITMAVEKPEFELLLQEGDFELRAYPALLAAQVQVTGSRSDAVNAGFRLLAAYIFGNNTAKQSIAMTAPVMQTEATMPAGSITVTGTPETMWLIQFVMPKTHSLQSLPSPNDARVHFAMTRPGRCGFYGAMKS